MLTKLLPLVALLALLTACSSAAPGDGADAPEGAAGGPFPVQVEHTFGTTEIPERPQRVVALGVTDADPVLALGVTPVATASYTFYEQTGGLGPWARGLVQGEPPVVLTGEPNLEQIAALAPDVILAVSSGIEQPMYEQLSAIAPVVARPAGTIPFGVTRDDQMRTVATALGEPERGEELIRQADAAFTDAVEAHPQFRGKVGATVLPFDGKYGAFTAADARGRFMSGLGFVQPPRIAELDDGESFFVEISAEQTGLLDGDTLVMLADEGSAKAQVDGDAVLAQVPVVAQGRMVVPDADTRGAMTYNSVLSAPYALERLVPQLDAALSRAGS
ncbi:iron-siderophore ABC transporter substrate-binding protein [Pseudonocardia parietis]|uniref:Iron complex transport system substrate-binding protein n=1 Tax=Pseudonocardia parietis TaxID=570936 RepID=A0ABS4VW18_9PSEU|nr:iron-siderophore ABC transporter substrate-binding protein [Pseudonocardia parietis]MBP2368129.1 iron complex transport system substrate-binding protein [Pseudonocardia parietis]